MARKKRMSKIKLTPEIDPSFKEINIEESYNRYCDSHWIEPEDPEGKSGLISASLYSVVPIEHSKESFALEIARNLKFRRKWAH